MACLLWPAWMEGCASIRPGNMLYAVNSTTDQLIGFDTSAKVQRFAVPLGRNFASGSQYASGMMAGGAGARFYLVSAGCSSDGHPPRTVTPGHFEDTRFCHVPTHGRIRLIRKL